MTFATLGYRLKSQLLHSRGAILCFHRIGKPDAAPLLSGNRYMWMADATLDRLLSHIRENLRLPFIPLAEQIETLGRRRPVHAVSVTFDDGYRDNLTHALPVLEAHGVPATVFVATGLIDGTAPLWWVALEDRAATVGCDQVGLTFDDLRRDHLTGGGRTVAARMEDFGIAADWAALAQREMMSWSEIRTAAEHPLLTIAAHTVSHPNLTALSTSSALAEMVVSRNRIADEIGTPPKLFAYPFGSLEECGPREFALAREAGFTAAVTTYAGNLYKMHRQNLFALPRTCLSEPQLSFPLLNNKLSGYDDFRRGRRRANGTEGDLPTYRAGK